MNVKKPQGRSSGVLWQSAESVVREWEPMQEERFNTICLLVGIGLGCYTFIEFFKMMV